MSPEQVKIDQGAAKRFGMVRTHLKNKTGKMLQSDLAEVCGVTQGMIGHMENGRREITFNVLSILFTKFNINPSFIIIGGDEEIEYKKPSKTLITDTRELRAEIEILRARIKKMEQDIRILSQVNN